MDTDPDKLAAALSELMTERRRRLEARGEVPEVRIFGVPPDDFVCDGDDDVITCIITGVPDPDPDEPEPLRASDPSPRVIDEIEPIARYEGSDVSATYIWTTLRPATEIDPGCIAEGYYRIEGGSLIVEDARHEVIAAATLEPGDDPARVTRRLLLENADEEPGAPISYPKIRLA
jgi:hypothetical protein